MPPYVLSQSDIDLLDTGQTINCLKEYPENIRQAISLAKAVAIPKSRTINNTTLPYQRPQGVLIVGMGGSGIAGTYLRDLAAITLDIPVVLVNGQSLPRYVNSSWLVICVSYSGNTQETLDSFYEAYDRKAMIVVVSSGGQLVKETIRYGIPCVQIPPDLPPRMAFPYLVIPVIQFIEMFQFELVSSSVIAETIEEISQMRNKLVNQLFEESPLQSLSAQLHGKTVIAYGAGPFFSVAYRFKCQLNENAKMLAWAGDMPEVCHNEIVGWENYSGNSMIVVLFRDSSDLLHVKHRYDLVTTYLQDHGVKVININGTGSHLFTRMMTATYYADWISYYLAIQNQMDPGETDSITWLKQELSRRLNP